MRLVANFLSFLQPISFASFEGDGYLELNSQPLRENSALGLSFQTDREDGLLLLSTFQGQSGSSSSGGGGGGISSSDLGNFYSVSLVAGRLEFVFASSSDPGNKLTYRTEETFSDGRLHTAVVLRRGQK